MDNSLNTRVVTIKDLWDLFVHRFWVMVLAVIICMTGAFGINYLTFEPQYASTATLYILKQYDDDTSQNNSLTSTFSLALNVVNDCTYLLKSHAVLDEVIDQSGIDISYKNLYNRVSTTNPESTRILEVTVEGDTPEQAKMLVDAICTVGAVKIEDAMGFSQVNLYEYGTLEKNPCNKRGLINYILVGITTAMLVYAAFLVLYLLDDTIQTEEDIEQYLGLSILGDIPNADTSKKKHYGYYKRYGYGKAYGKNEYGSIRVKSKRRRRR